MIREDLQKCLNKANSFLTKECENVSDNWPTAEVADNLEYAIWAASGYTVSKDYKDKYRLLVFNMNDPNNREFRESVCKGLLSPTQIVSLSETDLMSSEKRAEIEALKIKANEARVIDIESAALMNTTAAELYAKEKRRKK